jgi:hypothetical protein
MNYFSIFVARKIYFINRMIRPFLVFVISIVSMFNLSAQEVSQKPSVRFLLAGALEFGGDRVAEIYFTNGDTQSVNAGQGGTISAGLQYQHPKLEKLLLRASLGIKYVTTQADNAHIRLTRLPAITTANWMITEKIRIGAGLAMHRNIKFNADGIGPNLKFSPASGPVFEIAYRGIGLSYTSMMYKDQLGQSYSANAFGVTFSGVFPKK